MCVVCLPDAGFVQLNGGGQSRQPAKPGDTVSCCPGRTKPPHQVPAQEEDEWSRRRVSGENTAQHRLTALENLSTIVSIPVLPMEVGSPATKSTAMLD